MPDTPLTRESIPDCSSTLAGWSRRDPRVEAQKDELLRLKIALLELRFSAKVSVSIIDEMLAEGLPIHEFNRLCDLLCTKIDLTQTIHEDVQRWAFYDNRKNPKQGKGFTQPNIKE